MSAVCRRVQSMVFQCRELVVESRSSKVFEFPKDVPMFIDGFVNGAKTAAAGFVFNGLFHDFLDVMSFESEQLVGHYEDAKSEIYGFDLELADNTGMYGYAAFRNAMAMNTVVNLTGVLADGVGVYGGTFAGVNTKGTLFQKMAAASKGTSTAARIKVEMKVLGRVNAVGGCVSAFATGYSVGARISSARHAVYRQYIK